MRKAQPYKGRALPETGLVVGGTPTLDTRRRYGAGAFIGLKTSGSMAAVVPLNEPWAGQGARFPQFPFVLPSDVAPNAIRPALMSAQNFFSPGHHSTDPSVQAVLPAIPPGGITGSNAPSTGKHSVRVPQKQLHGTGGRFTLPDPPNFPNWPTIMDRLIR